MITLQCLGITLVLLVVFTILTVREQRIQDKLNLKKENAYGDVRSSW